MAKRPADGWWYIMIYGFREYSQAVLSVRATPG